MLAKIFCSNMEDTKYPCVCRRTKLPGRGVHSEKVREIEINSRLACRFFCFVVDILFYFIVYSTVL